MNRESSVFLVLNKRRAASQQSEGIEGGVRNNAEEGKRPRKCDNRFVRLKWIECIVTWYQG